jgi:diguanylate cyclase (GGDEF)-like protein
VLDSLDVRTLLVAIAVVSLLTALGMARFARRFPSFPGIAWIAVADLLLGIGMLLVATRDHAPEWLTTVVANLFTLGGLMLNAEGLRRYAGGRWPWWSRPYVLFLLLMPLSAWFTFVEPDVRVRLLGFTACAALTLGGIAVALNASPSGRRLRFVVLAFGVFAAWMAGRWVLTFLQAPMPSFMSAGGVHALTLLTYLIFVLVKDFGVLQDIVRCSLDEVALQARTDPLTGLLNRRALTELAQRAMAHAVRHGSPLSVVLIDIDHFKQINDTHGHAAGDAVLVGLARLLNAHLRAGDACARLGGEEFLLLLPGTSRTQAVQVAEKLRLLMASEAEGAGIRWSSSFGVCSSDGTSDFDRLLQRADEALYRAKAGGRNRVECAPEGTP